MKKKILIILVLGIIFGVVLGIILSPSINDINDYTNQSELKINDFHNPIDTTKKESNVDESPEEAMQKVVEVSNAVRNRQYSDLWGQKGTYSVDTLPRHE
jgi:hypothetical protein